MEKKRRNKLLNKLRSNLRLWGCSNCFFLNGQSFVFAEGTALEKNGKGYLIIKKSTCRRDGTMRCNEGNGDCTREDVYVAGQWMKISK